MRRLSHLFRKWVLAVPVLLYSALPSFAQALADSLDQDQKQIIDAIAPYPAAVRSSILQAATYPQVLVKLERTQARTSQAFQDLLKSFPQSTQEQFYEISRYPDLLNSLVANGRQTPAAVHATLSSYPADLQKTVQLLYDSYFDTLAAMNKLYQSSQRTFSDVVKPYSPQAQQALKAVVDRPEVMTLLTDHIDLTISLGEAFTSDPSGVSQELDSLNGTLAAQSAKDLAAYKEKVAQDPQLQAEMKKASDEFARSYADETGSPTTVVNNYYTTNNYAPAPYPYWFGYPYWQPAPVWYPRPLYFQTGFYVGPGGHLVIVGLPSASYAGWFFSFGRARYPHLYHQYNTYYNIHRTNITNINVYRGFNHSVQNHFGEGRPPRPTPSLNGPRSPVSRPGFDRGGSEPRHAAAQAPATLPAHQPNEVHPVQAQHRRPRATASRPAPAEKPGRRPALTPIHLPEQPARSEHNGPRGAAPRPPSDNGHQGNGFNPHALDAFHAHAFHQQAWGGMGMHRGRH